MFSWSASLDQIRLGSVLAVVNQALIWRKGAVPLEDVPRLSLDLPQACHRLRRIKADDGGFLRVSENPTFVAKLPFGPFL